MNAVPAATTSVLDRRIADLAGVSASFARAFASLEISTLGDLLEYFPRDYRFESEELPIAEFVADQVHIARGEVVAVNYTPMHPRPRFEATIFDGTAKLALVWFNGAWLKKKIVPGMHLRVQGKVKYFKNIPSISNPKWSQVDEATERVTESRFRPIYPASVKLTSDAIANFVQEHLPAMLPEVEEWFAPELLWKHDLIGRREAYRLIHAPANLAEAQKGRRRLVYDELMLMQLALGISKSLRGKAITAPVLRIDKLLDERIRKRFPFTLTKAQESAVYEIARDMQSGQPMNRLLQGDVGSGKTVVALYGMLTAVANKLQAALLAPTEVLAEQHYLTLSKALENSAVSIELFTHRTKKQSKGSLMKALGDGKVHIAVGTQALLGEDIEFANLGLVVVDEQHKLGVRQRGLLKSKGMSPHYLIMTATPIPRTLALSYFADFDVTTLNELPPGRLPIKTRWLPSAQAQQAYDFIKKQVSLGHQAYLIVPQVDETGGGDDAKSVVAEHKRLNTGPLAGLKLAMLHGQMSTEDKQSTMAAFRQKQHDVLIATTVIEVGIDVPNATVIVIDNADRFGLSQLHQLRGRVGRGKEQSFCLLIGDPRTESAEERLRALCQSTNGFDIAETDLKLRGPGEFFGTRQHGLPEFKLADLSSELILLHQAREDALAMLKTDPRLTATVFKHLRQALLKRFGDTMALVQIG
ncbi:ATP-dependent DNA helicase RecG [Humisphaera borealis]|uniref:ATP-dependent DNA helicase RecG n=1 Tax=Humisphaera borealis TaxID=2807512 RepID=A0A7M2WSP2_9BACT|nr:ATP-dependent DNA helicase RecG [Humisphaera borealis]QOV88528.1 ATP-dependent DNA helicase RecG [Humisphaera borealis]